MAPEEVALEHCEIDNVAGISMELERVNDGESPKRQNVELECENCGERDRSEEVPVDGNGSVVEALAQDWSPLDREMHHECAYSHPRASALRWSRGQNGLFGNLREGPEMLGTSVVEMATKHPKRFKINRWEDIVSTKVSKVCGNADAFANLSSCLQNGYILHRVVGNGGSFAKIGEKPDFDVVIVTTQWRDTQSPRVSKRAWRVGGKISNGDIEWRRMVDTSGTM